MKVIIDIDEEDFKIMQYNVTVDNPLCPLGEKEIVTKIANGVSIPNDVTNGNIIKVMFPKDYTLIYDRSVSSWWNAKYKGVNK